VDGNKIIVNDENGITFNIGAGKTLNSLTLNQPTTLAIGKGAKLLNPIAVNANSTIITKENVPAIIRLDVIVTLKSEKGDEEGVTIVGIHSEEPIDFVAAAVESAEKAIANLPTLENARITHKEAVLKAKALVDIVKALDPTASIVGEHSLVGLLEKIEYLENEESKDIGFTQVFPTSQPQKFRDSKVDFEGYFYGAKYLEKVLIGNVEADLEYVPDYKYGPAYKYSKEIEFESGYYEEKIYGISQSGKQTNTVARFFVDTVKPTLDIGNIDENNKLMTDVVEDSVEVEVTMKDNFYDLELHFWGNHGFIQESDGGAQLAVPANVTESITVFGLEEGDNEVDFVLTDAAGNETTTSIIITRTK
jgi:hypothetical protein